MRSVGAIADRSQLYKDIASGPFFGANRPGAKVSQGMIDSFWLQGMQAGHKNTFDCIKAFSETDFTEDLKKFDVPTLIVHGDDDQIVPIGAAALRSAKLVKNATLKIYPGAPHGLADTHKDQLNADLLAFLIIPANRDLHIDDRKFHLEPISKPRGWPDVITVFLRSLTRYWDGKLIAVIVSGYDGDGAAALCGIQEVGGITIAQKLATATQPDMPESAIDTGCIDFVLSPEDISHEIVRIACAHE
jgi:hypothetical protein